MSHRTQSQRTASGRFVNSIPERTPPMLRLLREWISTSAPSAPDAPMPVERRTRTDFNQPPATGLRVTWLGHATTLVEIDGRTLLIDPVWAERVSPIPGIGPKRFFEPPLALEELPHVDAVLISHDHYDHLDRRTVEVLGMLGLPFITPLGVGDRLIGWGVPRNQISQMDWWESREVGGVTITATPARHFSGRSAIMIDRNRTLWCGFTLIGPQHKLYYTGDSAMFEGFAQVGEQLGPFDATMVEIGAYDRLWADVHLGPEQAVHAVREARGGLIIPLHWATFNLAMHGWTEPIERLLAEAERTGARVVAPRPGQQISPDLPVPVERWWPSLPWQSATEHPIVSSGTRQTAEYASRATPAMGANGGMASA